MGFGGARRRRDHVDDVSVSDAASIAGLVLEALDAIQPSGPAPITSVNVPVDDATEAVKSWQESGFDVFAGGQLRRMGLNAATVVALSEAMSDPRAERWSMPGSIETAPAPRVHRWCRSRTDRRDGSRCTSSSHARFGAGLDGHLPGNPAAGTDRRQGCLGHASVRRVGRASPGLNSD